MPPEPIPSATVLLIRAAKAAYGIEVLLLKRSAGHRAHADTWAFPGGVVETADDPGGELTTRASEQLWLDRETEPRYLEVARRCAVRETDEEVRLDLDPGELTFFAHWTTPAARTVRHATWFFVAQAPEAVAKPDGREILSARWMSPIGALEERDRGGIALPPPTFVTLHELSQTRDVGHAIGHLARAPVKVFRPALVLVEGGAATIQREDAAYPSLGKIGGGMSPEAFKKNIAELDTSGPRHRVWLLSSGWHYERDLSPQ